MGSVFLDNVDDYLAPSQACINPLFTSDRTPADKKTNADSTGTDAKSDGANADGTEPGAGMKVKPRRMRVVRRKGSAVTSRQSSAVSNDTGSAGSGDAMDIDTMGNSEASASESPGPTVVSKKRIPRRQPIALTYQAHDEEMGVQSPASTAAQAEGEESASVPKKKKATVSVADCLACSGCVTSAEAVMVQSHSISTLRKYVAANTGGSDKKTLVVFTISPASLSDIIRHLYMNGRDIDDNGGMQFPQPEEVLGRIATFLHQQFNASMVIDGTVVQQLSLIESAEEFCERYLASRRWKDVTTDDMDIDIDGGGASNIDFPLSTPSIALSSTETRYLVQKRNNDDGSREVTEGIVVQHAPGRDSRLDQPDVMARSSPVVTSSCPGFVCYVEKTAPAVIPNLSTAKSPMACSGTLVKHFMSLEKDVNQHASRIYHVAIMPCHDKKLEAGRKDLAWERSTNGSNDTVPDIDLVLTTAELLTLLSDAAADSKMNSAATGSISVPSVGDETKIDAALRSVDSVRSFLDTMALTQPTDRLEGSLCGSGNTILLESGKRSAVVAPSTGQTETVRMIGSGAYAEFCFRYAARKLFEFIVPDNQALPWKQVMRGGTSSEQDGNASAPAPIRRRRAARGGSVAHSDMAEVVLYRLSNGSYSLKSQVLDGVQAQPVLKFATAYGFKNVQLVLMQLGKRGEASGGTAGHNPEYYDFIEVMACPAGCLNGGGQIRDDDKGAKRETPVETRQRVGKSRKVMDAIGLRAAVDYASPPSDLVSTAYLGRTNKPAPLSPGPFGREARKLLHTRFHVVPKLELSTGATAGVALDDTVW